MKALQQILSADSAQAAIDTLHRLLAPSGLSGVVYACQGSQSPLLSGTDAVRRWVAHFMACNYFATDPLYAAAKQSLLIQPWRAHQTFPHYTDVQTRMYAEIGEFGIQEGFDLSVEGAGAQASLCFYFQEDISTDARPDIHHRAQLGTLYLHERVKQIHRDQAPASTPWVPGGRCTPALTSRERECLAWVSAGLTYPDISRRLGISTRTVTFHLHNAKHKLDVQTLPQALAVAMAKGLLPLTLP